MATCMAKDEKERLYDCETCPLDCSCSQLWRKNKALLECAKANDAQPKEDQDDGKR